jgi:hypothetical protein
MYIITGYKMLNVMEFLKELFIFLKTRKKYWLVPLIIILLMLGALLLLAGGTALAPFIYSIF